MTRTIIHIGMARAASTFLQNRVFPHIRDFAFHGVETTQYSPAFQNLLYLDDTLYDAEGVFQNSGINPGQNILLSNELFTGQSLYLNAGNRTRTAHRLKSLFPDAEILLILRNQASLMESLYALAVYAGHTQRPEAFIHFGEERSDGLPSIPTFEAGEYLPMYRYTPLVKLYRSLFEKVHVYLYEDFRADPVSALSHWLEELNLQITGEINFTDRINKSLTSGKLGYIRRSNHLKPLLAATSTGASIFRKNVQFAEHGPLKGKKFHFDPELSERIRSEFREDNRALLDILPARCSETLRAFYL